MATFIILIIIIAAIIIWFLGIYNKLIALIEEVNNNYRQIDIQLDRRFKVFESLIEVVKKYMDYEKTTLKDVISLRTQAEQAHAAGDEKTRMGLEDQISKIASNINLVFEAYPDLKASQNAMQLQEEIVNTENKLAFAKQAYNDSLERYNAKKKAFVESFIVTMFADKLDKQFDYWRLPEESIKAKEEYTVKF